MTLNEYYEKTRLSHVKQLQRKFKLSKEDAEDVVQEAFIRAYNSFHNFNPKKGALGAWFYTILIRSFNAFQRRDYAYAREKEIAELVAGPEAVEYDLPSFETERQKEVYLKICIEGLTLEQVAEQLEVAPKSVKQILYRIKKGMDNDYQ